MQPPPRPCWAIFFVQRQRGYKSSVGEPYCLPIFICCRVKAAKILLPIFGEGAVKELIALARRQTANPLQCRDLCRNMPVARANSTKRGIRLIYSSPPLCNCERWSAPLWHRPNLGISRAYYCASRFVRWQFIRGSSKDENPAETGFSVVRCN